MDAKKKLAGEIKEIGTEGIGAAITLTSIRLKTHHQAASRDTLFNPNSRVSVIIPSEARVRMLLKNIVKDGKLSKPFEKRFGERDSAGSLFLPKREVEDCILEEFFKEGDEEDLDRKPVRLPVTVYSGKDGNKYEMVFMKWEGRLDSFLNDHGLINEDFIAVWAFRHSETQKLCFVLLVSRRE